MAGPGFKRIVVATDGSETANAALELAVELARQFAAELEILSVAPPVAVFTTPNVPLATPTLGDDPVPRYRSVVEAAVERAQSAGVEHVTGLCEEGVPVEEILARLASDPADLLVVGSRGLSAAQRVLLGSVSTALVGRAPCPVLVVRRSAATPRR